MAQSGGGRNIAARQIALDTVCAQASVKQESWLIFTPREMLS